MDASIDIGLKQDIFQQLKQLNEQFNQLQGKVSNIEKTTTSSFSKISSSIKSISFVSITQSLNNLNQGFQDLNAPGKTFSSSMAEVSAITGVTGKQLDELGLKARASAKEFGGTAAESLESYKTILSRLGPDIAKDQTALAAMEKNVRILSKTMGNDAVGSVDALTTAMLQYGVDLSNPAKAQKEMARMMNVMAAGAKFGAAEVPSISAALKVSGVAAKQANVSFEETNAALQSLAAGGKEGSEAGTALRNVLGKMAGEDVIPKEAAEKLRRLGVNMDIVSNTSLPFATRLKELKKAQGDATAIAQVFGTENAAAANILLDSVGAQEKLTKQISGTTEAHEQAAVIMETNEEKIARMKASIDDAKISFFEATGGATAYLEPITQLATTFSSFAPLVSGAGKALQWLGKTKLFTTIATKTITAAQWLWNAAMMANPIGLIIAGVAALAVGIYATVKAFDSSTAAQRANAEVTKEVNMRMATETAELKSLFKQLKQTNPGTEERSQLVDDLKNKYPGLLDQYDLEHAKLSDIDKIQKEVIKNMRNKLTAEIKMEKAKELLKEAEDMKDDSDYWSYWGNDDKWSQIREKQKAAEGLMDDAIKLENKGASSPKKNSNSSPVMETPEEEAVTPLASPSGYQQKETNYSGAGGEVKNINVKIEKLIGELTISSSNINEGAASLRNKITEAMVGAVRDFEVSM